MVWLARLRGSTCRATIAAALVMPACGVTPHNDDESDTTTMPSDTGSQSDGESTAYDTSVAVCHAAACAAACSEHFDECLEPLAGACSAEGLCECVQAQPCPPCVTENCEPWQECASAFGVCMIPCSGSFVVERDPGSCEISVEHVPSTVLDHLLIDGMPATPVDDCADAGTEAAWAWLEQDVTMLICEETCAQLSAASVLEVAWWWPCE